MAVDMTALAKDLEAETASLREVLWAASASDWDAPTQAAGWSVRDQVAHLAYFDDVTVLAMTDPEEFRRLSQEHVEGGMDFPDRLVASQRSIPLEELKVWFGSSRSKLVSVAAGMDPKVRVPWYGPAMSASSCVTARLMETWAHGVDVADTLGAAIVASSRLRHVAHIGVGAFAYSFAVRALPVPAEPVRIELQAPDGGVWTWGQEGGADLVKGTALDFCLVVTQRRHRLDTGLTVSGATASAWIGVAQAFAGSPGVGRPPGSLVAIR